MLAYFRLLLLLLDVCDLFTNISTANSLQSLNLYIAFSRDLSLKNMSIKYAYQTTAEQHNAE